MLRDAFLLIDRDNTGSITFDEVINAFDKIGITADKVKIRNQIFFSIDKI